MMDEPNQTELESVVSTSEGTVAEPSSNEEMGGLTIDMIRQRILHTLWIYPKLSPSMLQVGIGTGFPPALWHPVLEQLINEGTVIRAQVQATNPVSKREQTYTILTATPADSI